MNLGYRLVNRLSLWSAIIGIIWGITACQAKKNKASPYPVTHLRETSPLPFHPSVPDPFPPIPLESNDLSCKDKLEAEPSHSACQLMHRGSRGLYVEGTLLTVDGVIERGGLFIDQNGVIQCTGCDCRVKAMASDASRISCPQGVISPGLINSHDHLSWTHNWPAKWGDNRYSHRHDWRGGIRDYPKISSGPSGNLANRIYGELRHLVSGTLSIAGSGSAPGLVRNLDDPLNSEGLPPYLSMNYNTFPLGDGGKYNLITEDCTYPRQSYLEQLTEGHHLLHVAEGIDQEARNEFLCLSSAERGGTNIMGTRNTIIHAIALNAEDSAILARNGTSVVWSPRSNLSLYGNTAPVTMFANQGINIALGSDWVPSGSAELLRELQCADQFNSNHLDKFFTDRDLWLMVTAKAASAMKVEKDLGRLADGWLGDIVVFRKIADQSPYRSIIEGHARDVVVAARAGKILYGDKEIIDQLYGEQNSCESFPESICGQSKKICLTEENLPNGFTLKEVLAENAKSYPLYFCGEPVNEPSCKPFRPGEYDGIAKEDDFDGDGIPDHIDNCPKIFNPVRAFETAQADSDGDGIGDACDPCPLDPYTNECKTFNPNDRSNDGIEDIYDNCPFDYNPLQEDFDGDGIGDVCDFCPSLPNPKGSSCPVQSIQELKQRHLNASLALESVRLGAFVSLTGRVTAVEENGFYLQDVAFQTDTPQYQGIYVYHPRLQHLVVGQIVQVTGTFANYYGQLQLKDSSIEVIDPTIQNPVYLDLPLADLIDENRAIAYEGSLVQMTTAAKVLRRWLTDPDDSSSQVSAIEIEGGLIIESSLAELDLPYVDDIVQVGGILRYSFNRYRLAPTSQEQIRYISRAEPKLLEPEQSPVYFTELGFGGITNPRLRIPLSRPVPFNSDGEAFLVQVHNPRPDLLSIPSQIIVEPGSEYIDVEVTGLAASNEPILVTFATKQQSKVSAAIQVLDQPRPQWLTGNSSEYRIRSGQTLSIQLKTDLPASLHGIGADIEVEIEQPEILGLISAPVIEPGMLYTEFSIRAKLAGISQVHLMLNGSKHTLTIIVDAMGLVISEVFYDPVSYDDELEWVELYNGSSELIHLKNYSLGYGGANYLTGLYQLDGELAPGDCIVVGGPIRSDVNFNPEYFQLQAFKPNLPNAGGSAAAGLALFDSPSHSLTADMIPIDAVIYGPQNSNRLVDASGKAVKPHLGKVSSSWSMERTLDGWRAQRQPTPNNCRLLSDQDPLQQTAAIRK